MRDLLSFVFILPITGSPLAASTSGNNPLRNIVFYTLTILTLLLTIVNAWGVLDFINVAPKKASSKILKQPSDMDAQLLEKQAKIVIGGINFFNKNSINQDPAQMKGMANLIQSQYLEGMFSKEALPEGIFAKMGRASLRSRVVLRNWFELDQDKALEELKLRQDKTAQPVDQLLIESIESPTKTFTEEERKLVQEKMKWMGNLYLQKNFKAENSSPEFEESLNKGFTKFVIGAAFLSIFALSSVTIFSISVFQYLRDKFNARFVPLNSSAHLLEIFCVYMAIMLSGSLIVKLLVVHVGLKPDLKIQVPIIVSSLLAILFPLLSGMNFKTIREDLGLTLDGWGKALRDITTTPLLYVGIWTPFFIVLLIYASILSALKLDVSQGGHPIVPILTQAPDNFKIALIFFLAVVCAPIIEEIMFRGALYGWLRTRSSATASVVISSLIFAAVHPQGPIGMVPLTMIGMFLAVLREWRGGLLAPMIAHACVNCGTLVMVLFIFR